jgi:hypothetical protein
MDLIILLMIPFTALMIVTIYFFATEKKGRKMPDST